MRQRFFSDFLKSIFLVFIFSFVFEGKMTAQCSSVTPTFTLDLTGAPNATSVTPSSVRNGTCCSGTVPCTKIVVLLNPNTMALKLTPTGADPGGALTYEFNCNGTQIPGGTPICLPSAGGSVTLTICKVGGNANSYSIEAVPKPAVPDSILLRSGCSQTLAATGFSVPSIVWTAVNAGTNTALFNSYLSCTIGCANVTVTPTGTVPVAFVDYLVSGLGAAPCETNFYQDTVRVFFYNDLAAPLSPTTICFGSISAVLSPTPTGGKPAYTYSWSTGSTSPSITVGAGSYTLLLFDATGCPPITSTVLVSQFTVPINANAGLDRTVCISSPSVAITGTISGVTTGSWSGGSGTIAPTNTALAISYSASPAEVSTGSLQLFLTTTNNMGCAPDIDTVRIAFQNLPTVSAGTDKTVCANNGLANITATVGGFPATVLWSTTSDGAISSPTNITTNYTPSSNDILTGSVNIIVTTTNNGSCPAARDTVKIIITPAPIVNAGTNQTICSVSSAALNGTVTAGASTGSWTSTGNGTFNPSASVLNASYTPGTLDVSTGSVSLVLHSTNNGNCLPVRDTVVIFLRAPAIVNAGLNTGVCAATGTIPLSGTVTGIATTGSWTSNGSGSFIPNQTNLNNSYSLSPTDITAGFVIFTLTSTNNGPCPAVNDSVRINVQILSTLTAGPNQYLCSAQNSINLAGIIFSSPGTGSWSANGSGSFANPSNSLNNTYSLTPTDILNGSVIFTLTSTNNANCPAVSDTVMMRIAAQATVNAGLNQNLCSNASLVALSGTVGGITTSGTWSTAGTGVITNVSQLATTYTLSPADIIAGSVIFTLTSTNNGPCPARTDTVRINITTLAALDAGNYQSVCSNQSSISLAGGVFTSPGTATWSSSGSGSFVNSASVIANSYSFSTADINAGLITFTLRSTNNGACPPVSDTVSVRLIPLALVNAGLTQALCSITPTAALSGTISGGTSTGMWSSNGAGQFINASSLVTTYSASAADALAGFVIFTLSSTNNGPCPIVTDTTRMRIVMSASVTATTLTPICSTQNTISLGGTVAGVNGLGTWTTSGSGTIQNPANLFTNYTVSAGDIQNGTVTFTLSSINNGPCPVGRSIVSAQIVKTATVNAGSNLSICSNTNLIALSGSVTGVSGAGQWNTNGSGGFSPSSASLSTLYGITPTDIANGSVIFTLSSTNNGPCPLVRDTVLVIITTLATVNSGSNQIICSNTASIVLSGSVVGSSSTGSWTAPGSGSFSPSQTNLNPRYTILPDDITRGNIVFTLSSTNNKGCPAVSNTVLIAIQNQATVNAGSDFTICSTQPDFVLAGNINGNTNTGIWSTNGSGTLTPNSSGLGALYKLNSTDQSAGKVGFVLQSTNNDVCPGSSDSLVLHIIKFPQLSLRLDTTICQNQRPFFVSGNISGGSGAFIWSTNGTGTFTPSNLQNPTYYLFGEGDLQLSTINLILKSTNNGPCGDVSKSMAITILPVPVAAFSASSYTLNLPRDQVTLTNESAGGKNYKWNFGDGETSNVFSPVHKYATVGYYTVELVAINEFACSDTSLQTLVVKSDINFPNAFTPNPNGPSGGAYDKSDYLSNDIFYPFTDGVTEYDLMIFNRWGELIFQSRELNVGWDGYFKGKLCQQDAYVWKANIKFFDGRVYSQTGTVTLLR